MSSKKTTVIFDDLNQQSERTHMNHKATGTVYYHEDVGLIEGNPGYGDVRPGMVHHLRNGNWRMRVRRRGSGFTWKRVPESIAEVKQAKAWGLVLGVRV